MLGYIPDCDILLVNFGGIENGNLKNRNIDVSKDSPRMKVNNVQIASLSNYDATIPDFFKHSLNLFENCLLD